MRRGIQAGVRQVIHHPQQTLYTDGEGRMGTLHLHGGKASKYLR